jgi:hypothetical protein
MKKNLVYIIIVLVLAGVVGYLVYQENNKYAVGNDQDFSTAEVDDLERIFLAAKDGRTVKLDKQDDYWMVNDSFKAMQAKVDLLLSTLKGLTIYSPVPEAAEGTAIKELATHSIKVELYKDADGAPFKVYFLGKPNQGQDANSMLMQIDGKSARKPYLVHIPGFVGNLQTRFLLNTSDWRDLSVFTYKLDEIQEVNFMYNEYPEASFKLTTEGDDQYTLQNLANKTVAPATSLFKAGINKFLDSFADLNAESVENNFLYKDSVTNGPKFATLTVKGKDGSIQEMIMYRMHANRRTKLLYDKGGNAIEFDPDHYYALFNNGTDFGVVQQYVFGKILRKYDDFLLKDPSEGALKEGVTNP